MPSIGPMEIVVVLVVALLILGPKRLPSAGRSLGEGMRGFKESISGATPRGSAAPQAHALTAAPQSGGDGGVRADGSATIADGSRDHRSAEPRDAGSSRPQAGHSSVVDQSAAL